MPEAELTLTPMASAPMAEFDALDALDRAAEPEISDELGAAVAAAPPFAFTESAVRPDPEVRRRDAIYRRLLALGDTLALALAFGLGVIVVQGHTPTLLALLGPVVLIVVAKSLGLYDRDQHLIHKTTLDEVPKLFHLSILAGFALFLTERALLTGQMSPSGLLAFVVTLFLGLTAARSIARRPRSRPRPARALRRARRSRRADELASKLAASGGTTVEFVGHLDHTHSRTGNGNGRYKPEGIGEFLVSQRIQRVVIAPGAERSSDMLALVGEIKSLGVNISVLPSITMAGGISFELDRIDGTTLLGVRGFQFNRSSHILKRSMDVVASGAALLFLAPLLAVIAIAIKATSPGPSSTGRPASVATASHSGC